MSRNLLKAEIDLSSLTQQLKKAAKDYGDTQQQAIKRWGVSTCRELAKYTQIFGKTVTPQKKVMIADGLNVLMTHKGGKGKTSATGRSVRVNFNGKMVNISVDRYLNNESEIDRWIQQHRNGKGRTSRLPRNQRKVCQEAVFKRVINTRYKQYAGIAKDGWIDAGNHIARRQRGGKVERIGASYIKTAQKPESYGRSREYGRLLSRAANITNFVTYSGKKNVLSASKRDRAIRDGAMNSLKFYRIAFKKMKNKKR